MAYSRRDEPLRDQLDAHLSMLKLTGRMDRWYDRLIQPGSDWNREIAEQLESSQLFLFLVSSDFLQSGYAMGIEVARAMELRQAAKAEVLPIRLRPCDSEGAPFHHLQALPRDGEPVMLWRNLDEALYDVVQGIKRVISGLEAKNGTD